MKLGNERECHLVFYFEDNDVGVDGKKAFLHAKTWDLYVNENKILLRVGNRWKLLVLTGIRFFGKWYTIM